MAKLTQRQQISFHAPSNVENHFNYVLPVPSDIQQRSSFSSGSVSPLTSRPVDDPGLEETGRRELRWKENGEGERARETRRRSRDERKRKRDRREEGRALVGGREMKWGLLWFRRWPVVTSSSARIDCSPRRGERPSDWEWEGEELAQPRNRFHPSRRLRRLLHLGDTALSVRRHRWARPAGLLAIRPCTFWRPIELLKRLTADMRMSSNL